jgi:hypothetical protein
MMRAGLKTDVKHRMRKKAFVLHGINGMHFGMGCACLKMISFPDDQAVMNNDRTYERIGRGVTLCLPRQLKTAAHKDHIIG